MRALGRAAVAPARVYLVGGATAVIEGWRATTIDVDLRVEPDEELLRHLPALKDRLDVNVELASPADSCPSCLAGASAAGSCFREGPVDVFHYDMYSRALAKLERGFAQDLADVEAMVARGDVDSQQLADLFAAIESELYRFPAVEPDVARRGRRARRALTSGSAVTREFMVRRRRCAGR